MMINKRLINQVQGTRKNIMMQVLFQWISLIANVIVMACIAQLLYIAYLRDLSDSIIITYISIIVLMIVIRYICATQISKKAFLSSKEVKITFRNILINKLLKLGNNYKSKVNTSEVVQVCVEGIDQLETYFGQYLPQLFYALLAPLTLFLIIMPIHLMTALILFICVPLIPITIIVIQKWAKKLLSKYWGQYNNLADIFLENIQGLTTTKIYQTDHFKHHQMNIQAEKFRVITMKVLTMQLNSITVMDVVAYGGAALGMICALMALRNNTIEISEAIFIILISADFFLPMRMLGSFFHIAMNGMAASDKMFKILDLPVNERNKYELITDNNITIKELSFSYDNKREVLSKININIPSNSFNAIVGESGCGKSTIASLLMGKYDNYQGEILIGNNELRDINEVDLMKHITYISTQSYIFKGTIKDNLLMAKIDASDEELWDVLKKAKLAEFVESENGLMTFLQEKGSNLSGGQRQRLALARAMLHDSEVYIFDEATSNIDIESENDILKQIMELAKTKTVIMISHRLVNVVNADNVVVIDSGKVVQQGVFSELVKVEGTFKKMWDIQQDLEKYNDEVVA